MKKVSREEQQKMLFSTLKKDYEHWNDVFVNGCDDPSWPDGTNLNLIRTHIIIDKKRIKEFTPETYPDEYFWDIPEEVENSYMAQTDVIKINAKKSLQLYESNEDYIFIVKNKDKLNSKQKTEMCINNVLGYVECLKKFIEIDDYLNMRRHAKYPQNYIESFSSCRRRIEVFLPFEKEMPFGQLTIFDYL